MAFFKNIDFESLSEVDRSIWNYLSTNNEKIPYMRVRDVAHESHTSPSSVMRFIRKLGYENFPEFRMDFKNQTVEKNSERLNDNILKRENFPKDLEYRLSSVAESIIESENIIFFGIGSSGYTCEYAARLFSMLGFNAHAITDNTYPIFKKLENTSDNIFVSLSITGNTSEVLEMMNIVKNRPDFISVAITSDVASQLALMSDHVLNYRVILNQDCRHMDFTSHIPSTYLIELLCEEVRLMQEKIE